ncbi:hypothetical protein PENTCL1PPCAC_12835, partial [Pristionchus entomophagus]
RMRRSPRSLSSPKCLRPAFKASPSPKPVAITSMWKEFEKDPQQQRENWAKRVTAAVDGLKGDLVEYDAVAGRSDELDKKLSQLQMKFGIVYEQYTLSQMLADSTDEVDELFGVDTSARLRDVTSLGLSPLAEGHVAAGVREWQAKIDDTPWARQVRASLDEEAKLMARRDQLRASIEMKRKQMETVNRMRSDERFLACGSRDEAEAMLTYEMRRATVNDEEKEDEFKSEDEETDPSVSPATGKKRESDSDQEEEDFIDSI